MVSRSRSGVDDVGGEGDVEAADRYTPSWPGGGSGGQDARAGTRIDLGTW